MDATIRVKMLNGNGKEVAYGSVNVNYPVERCDKIAFIGLQEGTVSCSGFNVDLIGLSTEDKGKIPRVDGGVFYIFFPNKDAAPAILKNGQMTTTIQGNQKVELYLNKMAYLKHDDEIGAEVKLVVRRS